MEATEDELKWAARIRQAAARDANVDETLLTDFETLQHAVVAKDDVSKALKRIQRIQAFKKRYGIRRDGSYDEGVRDVRQFFANFPGFVLSLGHTQDEHMCVMACDYTRFHAKDMKSEEAYCVFMRGMFYIMQASQPHTRAMRAGHVCLADCHRMGWRNFSLEFEERAIQLYSQSYPIRVVQMAMLRAPLLVRLFYGLIKYLLSRKMRETIHIHHSVDRDGWLEESNYPQSVLPEAWGGTLNAEDTLTTVLCKLQERYDNAAKFKL